MKKTKYVVRRCTPEDLPAIAKLAGRLVREHHRLDPLRFMIFDDIEDGYAAYFAGEIGRRRSLILVAAAETRILGYAYGRMEPRDWSTLRDRCGAIHDIYIDSSARRKGIATVLMQEMIRWLADLGAPRVCLMTAAANTSAHQLFHSLGFRTTMLEMMIECRGAASRRKH